MLVTRDTEKPKICSVCSSTENIEEHHIVPVSLGGRNESFNRVYLCNNCHAKVTKNWRDIFMNLNVNGVVEVGG